MEETTQQNILQVTPPKMEDILTYNELDRLLAAPDELEDLTFLHVGIFGGLRISEILGLRVKDVLYDDFALHVRKEKAKNKKERWAPVTATTISLLRILSQDKNPDDLVFTRKARAYQIRLNKMAEKAGLDRKINPHMMRHTCASMQLERGIDVYIVAKNLGHSKIQYVEEYLHLDIRKRRRKYQDGMRGIL